MDNRERARARDKKTKDTNFAGRITRKFYSGGEKMRNASGHQGENEWQRKKVNRNSYNISSIKRVTRTFHFVVVQNNGKEMYKKCVARAKLFFAN